MYETTFENFEFILWTNLTPIATYTFFTAPCSSPWIERLSWHVLWALAFWLNRRYGYPEIEDSPPEFCHYREPIVLTPRKRTQNRSRRIPKDCVGTKGGEDDMKGDT
ncbi:hypothetical protein V866_007084 [Kwoniella sp. B9012]